MLFFIHCFCFLLIPAFSQYSKDSVVNKKKLYPFLIATNTVYAGSLIYLAGVWYQNEEKEKFHLFNDLPEWKQMDKAGHITTSFHESMIVAKGLIWSGVNEKKAILYGSLAGFLYQAPIELLDGYSPAYGASISDLFANAVGSGLLAGQYLAWKEIRIKPKFSFHTTAYSAMKPELLGRNFSESLLKDYNGQTYWLSFNISSFLKNENKFPKWVNLSIGYGAEEMIRGRDFQNRLEGLNPYRQYYLSMDFDLSFVNPKRKWLKILLYPLEIIHIPFPAIELNKKGLVLHPIYF